MDESSWAGDGLRQQEAVADAAANERYRFAVATVLQGLADMRVPRASDRANPIPRMQGI